MKNIKNILKDTPEYESYSRNEAKLTTEEMQELGINTCKKGCCNKQSNGFRNVAKQKIVEYVLKIRLKIVKQNVVVEKNSFIER